jgi:hypothetical protein
LLIRHVRYLVNENDIGDIILVSASKAFLLASLYISDATDAVNEHISSQYAPAHLFTVLREVNKDISFVQET